MTRRGTLAYYLAAWVVGCFVVSLMEWLSNLRYGRPVLASELLTIYFIALIFGAVETLLFALLLRRVMRLFQTRAMWIWLVMGGLLSVALTFLLARLGDLLSFVGAPDSRWGGVAVALLFLAPKTLWAAVSWPAPLLVPVSGALIAIVLCLVDRAFVQRPDNGMAGHSGGTSESRQAPA